VSSRADAGGPVNGIRKAVATQTPKLTAAGTTRPQPAKGGADYTALPQAINPSPEIRKR